MRNPDELIALLDYEQDTGVFRWHASPARRVKAGAIAGRIDAQGYVLIGYHGHAYLAHRLAWRLIHGTDPSGVIDHINGDKADNRPENLRDVTRRVNCQNRAHARCDSATGAINVSLEGGRYRVKVADSLGIVRSFGSYADIDEARQVAARAKIDLQPGAVATRLTLDARPR